MGNEGQRCSVGPKMRVQYGTQTREEVYLYTYTCVYVC